MANYEGKCLCGVVQYRISGEESAFYHCHCERCRRATGTGHASNVRIQTDRIEWLQGEDKIRQYKVPEAIRFRNDFCEQCGSPLPRLVHHLGFAVVPAGSLNTIPTLTPQARIFKGSAISWSCADSLPDFDEYPPS